MADLEEVTQRLSAYMAELTEWDDDIGRKVADLESAVCEIQERMGGEWETSICDPGGGRDPRSPPPPPPLNGD